MRIRAVLSAVVLACSLSACTNAAKPVRPSAAPPPGEVVARAEKTPLAFHAKPLWTDRTEGAPSSVDTAALYKGNVIMFNRPPKSNLPDQLFVLDAATGRPRWSVRKGRPLPGGHGDMWAGRLPLTDSTPQIVGRGSDWGVLVTTRHGEPYSSQAAYGLALLSGEDGHPLWRQSILPRRKSSNEYVDPGLALTDGGVVVAGVRSHGGKVADLRLIGFDALSGKRLWTHTGMLPVAISREYVIATEWPVPASTTLDAAGAGTVTVLDELTGRVLWSLRGRIAAAGMDATAGGLLLVSGQQDNTPIALTLDTGTEVGRMPKGATRCAGDGVNLMACSSVDSRLYTIRSDERKIRVAGHAEPEHGVITRVQDDRIYYSSDGHGQEVDRSGTPLAGDVPDGLLLALDDKYAVFRDETTVHYRVYRVG